MPEFKPYEPKMSTRSGINIELISFTKFTLGNCAVVHCLDEDAIEPWIAVRNLMENSDGSCFWDHGFYFSCRRYAEQKFYEMTGVLPEKKK